jgi:DNA-binding protein HU-beta
VPRDIRYSPPEPGIGLSCRTAQTVVERVRRREREEQKERLRQMSKKDLIDAIADHAEITKDKAGTALDAITNYVEAQLKAGEEVNFAPLGKFKVTHRAAREGRNPLSGEKIKIAASNVPKFTPSKTLKDALNTPKKGAKKK